MNRNIFFVTFIALLSCFQFSCGSSSADSKKETGSDSNETRREAGLTLNDGAKWKANAETTTGINNMIRYMSEFDVEDASNNYAQLYSQLNHEYTMIFQNCTMEGEAHNQLHFFLIPIKGMLVQLNSDVPQLQKENFAKLNDYLKSYADYFE